VRDFFGGGEQLKKVGGGGGEMSISAIQLVSISAFLNRGDAEAT
jgi:hypothetical protein